MQIPALIFRFGYRHGESCLHKGSSQIGLVTHAVHGIRVQPAQSDAGKEVVCSEFCGDNAQQCLTLILRGKFPYRIFFIFIRTCQTVIGAVLDKGIIFLKCLDLCPDFRLFLLRQFCRVQFVTKG